jgi:hypothetical protein
VWCVDVDDGWWSSAGADSPAGRRPEGEGVTSVVPPVVGGRVRTHGRPYIIIIMSCFDLFDHRISPAFAGEHHTTCM